MISCKEVRRRLEGNREEGREEIEELWGDGRCRPDKRGGDKEEMVLDWTCREERSEQRLCC